MRQEIQTPRKEGISKLASQPKLPVRDRLSKLFDAGAMVEDGMLANAIETGLPADGVITGIGRVSGRRVAAIANDPLVKAGSWGVRTVEKIIRMQEMAERLRIPLLYLVDSAGARITDQVEMFPGRVIPFGLAIICLGLGKVITTSPFSGWFMSGGTVLSLLALLAILWHPNWIRPRWARDTRNQTSL